MKSQYIIVLILQTAISRVLDIEKKNFCANLACQDFIYDSVCGFRSEGEGFRLRLFENECKLLKYGCNVDDEKGNLLLIKKTYKNLNAAGLEPAPPGNRPGRFRFPGGRLVFIRFLNKITTIKTHLRFYHTKHKQ